MRERKTADICAAVLFAALISSGCGSQNKQAEIAQLQQQLSDQQQELQELGKGDRPKLQPQTPTVHTQRVSDPDSAAKPSGGAPPVLAGAAPLTPEMEDIRQAVMDYLPRFVAQYDPEGAAPTNIEDVSMNISQSSKQTASAFVKFISTAPSGVRTNRITSLNLRKTGGIWTVDGSE